MRALETIALALLATSIGSGSEIQWRKQTLLTEFVSEGACVADLDGDNAPDLVSGPYWWKGPSFETRYSYREVKAFDPHGYSDHFFSFPADLDGDGDVDLVTVGFPGKQATAYWNHGNVTGNQPWRSTIIAEQVANESPAFVDLIPGGTPELVCSRDGRFGYYQSDGDVAKVWRWNPISDANVTPTPFGHGLGVGDVDGDGLLDVIDATRWWKQPAEATSGGVWQSDVWSLESYGPGGAQILVHDVDGNGLNDIVTALHAHGYGLAWFAQKEGQGGRRRFIRNDILGSSSLDNAYGVVFSQLHSLALADIDGDGFQDIVTGKRYWAHGGKDPGGGQAPVLYWFSGARDTNGEISFQPHQVDDASGVGTEVVVADLDSDGQPDIVSANKLGVAIHFKRHHGHSLGMEPWNQGSDNDSEMVSSRSPEDAVSAMRVPEGFSIDLIASEPDLAQPIAMCFDARGRIWVAEGHTYPVRAPEGEGRDRILILEDSDQDGTFETRKVFIDGLNLVSGIEIGFGGVWVGAAPYLMFIPDQDSDDVPDQQPTVLLDGWGYQDTHETLNSFTWGPDGWLYGCHGVFTHSRVGKPGTADSDRVPLNAAIWRFHPTRHEFEVFSWGGSNPWGIDFDNRGEWFMECCVIPHLFHVIQGARYHRQAGQHFNPHIYEDLPTIADHLHYGDGTFESTRSGGRVDRELVRRNAASTSMVGGGHAHCGMAIYLGDAFPDSYHGDLFFHNLHGHRIVRDAVVADGSGYVGHHRPDLMRAMDHAFVGVGVMLGPDGALYFSDWHDPQTCHHRDPEVWDRSNGRIFRLRYGAAQANAIDLKQSTDQQLVDHLTHRNATIARQAALLLHERAAAGTLDPDSVSSRLDSLGRDHADRTVRLRVLWASHRCGMLDRERLMDLVRDEDESVRGWAIQLLAEISDQLSDADWSALAVATDQEQSLVTLRYLASAMQRMPVHNRIHFAESIARHPLFERDKNLPLLVWYALEPVVAQTPEVALARAFSFGSVREKVFRRAAGLPKGRAAMVAQLARAGRYEDILAGVSALMRWLPESKQLDQPDDWKVLVHAAEHAIDKRGKDEGRLRELLQQVGVRLGDASGFPFYRELAKDSKAEISRRAEAIELLRQAKDDQIGQVAASVLSEPALRDAATRAIVDSADPSVADDVIRLLPSLPAKVRGDLLNYLAARPATASLLLSAIESENIERSLLSVALLRQMRSHEDEQIRARIEKIWGRIQSTPENFEQRKHHWNEILTPETLTRADIRHGRFVFDQVCGNCHRLFGEGKQLGPDLTGSNRRDRNYVLENVLAPNAIIGNAYQMQTFLLDDGRLVTGLVLEETDQMMRIAMSEGTELKLDPQQIESRKLSDQSMMPTGLLEKMHPADVADLVLYLAAEMQVQPRESRIVHEGDTDPANVIEGEWLVDTARVSAGQVQRQNMAHFPDQWSGDAQLWWTGAERDATLQVSVAVPESDSHTVSLFLTTAVDYSIIRGKVSGQAWKTVDLFSPDVRQLPTPLRWSGVQAAKDGTITVTLQMTSANPKAQNRWMLGLDRVEVVPNTP